jgi:hypothetical protein
MGGSNIHGIKYLDRARVTPECFPFGGVGVKSSETELGYSEVEWLGRSNSGRSSL